MELKTEVKFKTPQQEKLIYQLLQSRVIKKVEFEQIWNKVIGVSMTTKDASIVIDWLLATIKLRKRFGNKRQRAHLKCSVCGTKENVHRLINVSTGKQLLLCDDCEYEQDRNR